MKKVLLLALVCFMGLVCYYGLSVLRDHLAKGAPSPERVLSLCSEVVPSLDCASVEFVNIKKIGRNLDSSDVIEGEYLYRDSEGIDYEIKWVEENGLLYVKYVIERSGLFSSKLLYKADLNGP